MNQRLGMNIYILRKSQGMTQDDLAEILNVSKMAVSKWERGLNFPNIEVSLENIYNAQLQMKKLLDCLVV